MSHVTLTLYGREYEIACEEGQQSHVKQLAAAVNKRMSDQARHFSGGLSGAGEMAEDYVWLLTILAMQEELKTLHDDILALQREHDATLAKAQITTHQQHQQATLTLLNHMAERLEGMAG
jgi:cell division protein ZapA